MKLSFIIPTLNEEKYIKQVINQFDQLKGKYNYEIIVSDGESTDSTKEIAKELGAEVYTERATKNIATGRNFGARYADGDIFIFCDADTLFENLILFVETTTQLFKNEKIIAAVPKVEVFPKERIWQDNTFLSFLNNFIRISFYLNAPFSLGQCQIVRREAFWSVNGYDEDRAHGEDSFLFKKLSKSGKIHFIDSCTIYESPRRYRKMGHLGLIKVGLKSLFMQQFLNKKPLNEWKRVD